MGHIYTVILLLLLTIIILALGIGFVLLVFTAQHTLFPGISQDIWK